MLWFPALAVALSLGPFTGPSLSGSVPGTAKFAVGVRGRPGASVRLRAVGVPRDYIASFCTDRVCAPYRVTFVLPRAGKQTIELQFIQKTDGARPPARVAVEADGTVRRSIAYARASH